MITNTIQTSMNESRNVVCIAFFTLMLSLLSESLSAQANLIDKKLQSLIESMQAVVAGDISAATVTAAREAAAEYVDALGNSSEGKGSQLLLDELDRHKSGPFLLAETSVTRLFDEVQYQRTRGRPERMIPPLLALQTRYPKDARVLYALGESFGVASSVFDAELAERSFKNLLEVLREKTEIATDEVGRGRLLSLFLPELSRAGLLLNEQPIDTTARLRQKLMSYCEKLSGGHPISLWQLADPQLDRLYEMLVISRRKRDQSGCRKLIECMLQIQPMNPVLQYSLAEVLASLGPEFDPGSATDMLDQFLQQTDPAILGGPNVQTAGVVDGAAVARDLARFRLASARSDLESERIAARALRKALKETKWDNKDYPKFIFSPNKIQLFSEIRRIKKHKLSGLTKRWKTARTSKERLEKALRGRRVTRQQRADYKVKISDTTKVLEMYGRKVEYWQDWIKCYEEACEGDLQLAIEMHAKLLASPLAGQR